METLISPSACLGVGRSVGWANRHPPLSLENFLYTPSPMDIWPNLTTLFTHSFEKFY